MRPSNLIFHKFYFLKIPRKRASGKISFYTTPPVREVSKPSESDWAKEFDVEKVFKKEASAVLAGLRPLVETDHVEVPSTSPLTVDFDSMVRFFDSMKGKRKHC